MEDKTKMIAAPMPSERSIFSVLGDVLHQTENNEFFEEVLQNTPRSSGDNLVIRVVSVLEKKKQHWATKLFSQEPIVKQYGIAFGSSEKVYTSVGELEEIFSRYFSSQARGKAMALMLPLVRLFLRKKIVIKNTLLEEIGKLHTSWIVSRQLGKEKETIVYFIFKEKLIRIDTQRSRVIQSDIERFKEKLLTSYPQLPERKNQLFALHEIVLNTKFSLLLPNNDELLTDVDKKEIHQALLSDPEGPIAFAKKLETLLSFAIPLLTDLKQEELKLYPHLLTGSAFNFIVGLNSVIRWSRQPEEVVDKKTGKKSIVLTYQDSKEPKKVETDLDHTMSMLAMASEIFSSGKYPHLAHAFSEKDVLNGIFVHDGGEPFSPFGDVTHADEERWQKLKETKDEVESTSYRNWWEKRMRLQGLREDVLKDLYAGFHGEEKTKVTQFVKFLDHFQAVLYGIQNIYPYEAVYKSTEKLKEFVQKYALNDLSIVMQQVEGKSQEELKRFFMNQLPFSTIEKSYEQAVASGRLEKEDAKLFMQAIEEELNMLYGSSAKEFMKKWQNLRSL